MGEFRHDRYRTCAHRRVERSAGVETPSGGRLWPVSSSGAARKPLLPALENTRATADIAAVSNVTPCSRTSRSIELSWSVCFVGLAQSESQIASEE